MILGLAGGGLLFVIVLILVATSGSKPNRVVEEVVDTKKTAPPPPPKKPDVSGLESEGKSKCAAGMDKIKPRLTADPSAPRDRVWADLEEGLKLLNAGLAAFKKATELAGKSYETSDFEKTRRQGIKLLCTDIEKEAQAACDKGLKVIQTCESRMTGKALEDADRQTLITDLEAGKKLIETGMNLFDRSYQVSDHMFDTTKYGQALKMTRGKLLELKK
ncbi:MAG TPA: hypothetical protein VF950_30795 [Planctomycetota bacterium]